MIVSATLNASALELAKQDGNFEKYGYTSMTDATAFMGDADRESLPAFFTLFTLFKINSLNLDKYILTLDNIHDIIPVNERRW